MILFTLFIIMASKNQKTTGAQKALADLKKLDRSDLQAELLSAKKELFVLTMKKDLGELKQTHMIRQARKYIARISTFLSSSL